MTTFFNKFKKPCFPPIVGPFSQFLGQNIFSGKSGFVTHTLIWVSSIMLKFRKKLMIKFQKNTQIEGHLPTGVQKRIQGKTILRDSVVQLDGRRKIRGGHFLWLHYYYLCRQQLQLYYQMQKENLKKKTKGCLVKQVRFCVCRVRYCKYWTYYI